MVKKGAWVMVESTVHDSVKKWVKGTLARRAQLGGPATIVTPAGRRETGILLEVNPSFSVHYGTYVNELRKVGDQVREFLRGHLIENTNGGDEL